MRRAHRLPSVPLSLTYNFSWLLQRSGTENNVFCFVFFHLLTVPMQTDDFVCLTFFCVTSVENEAG